MKTHHTQDSGYKIWSFHNEDSYVVFWVMTWHHVVWQEGTSISEELNASRCRKDILEEQWYPPIRLHGVVTQKTIIWKDGGWFMAE
jgi:hypothetical protein